MTKAQRIAELEAQVAQLVARIAALEARPAPIQYVPYYPYTAPTLTWRYSSGTTTAAGGGLV